MPPGAECAVCECLVTGVAWSVTVSVGLKRELR